jgi:hypothetical protein
MFTKYKRIFHVQIVIEISIGVCILKGQVRKFCLPLIFDQSGTYRLKTTARGGAIYERSEVVKNYRQKKTFLPVPLTKV